MLTLLHGPGCNLGNGRDAPSCALVGGFGIAARALRCYGNIARTRNLSECLYSLYAWLTLAASLGLAMQGEKSGV